MRLFFCCGGGKDIKDNKDNKDNKDIKDNKDDKDIKEDKDKGWMLCRCGPFARR